MQSPSFLAPRCSAVGVPRIQTLLQMERIPTDRPKGRAQDLKGRHERFENYA